MAEVASAFVSLIPSAKDFGKDTERQIGPSLDSAGKSGGARLSGALGGVLKSSALGIGVAAGGILGTALFKGFERLSAIDQAKAKLAGLGNSAATVSKIMDNALASVKGTAFGLGDAATVAAGAVASGIKPGKELTANLKLVADAATIAGVPLNEMGAIFNKVAASGKIQGDVIAQLGDKGIPILQLLGKQIGKTPAEVSKLASQGKIDFATFSKAMQDGLGGAALKSGNTFKGALANMYAALGRLGAGLLTGLFPIAKQVFGSLTTYLDTLTAKVTPLANALAAKLPGAMKAVGAAFKSLTAGGGGALKPLVDAIKSFVTDAVAAGVKAGPALLAIGKALLPLIKGAAVAGVVVLTVAFRALGPALIGVATAFANVVGFVQSNLTTFKVLAGVVGGVLLPVLIQTTVAAVSQGVALLVTNAAWLAYGIATVAISTTLKIVTAAQWLLNAALTANPIGLVVVAIAALAAGLIYAYTHFETFRSVVDAVFSFLRTAVTTVIDFVTAHWPLLLAIITGPIGLAALFIIDHWNQIKAATVAAWNAVKAAVSAVLNAIKTAIFAYFNAYKTVIITAWNAVKSATTAAFNTIKSAVSTAMSSIKTAVSTGISSVVKSVAGLPGKAKAAIGDLGGTLKDAGIKLISGFIDGIGSKFGDVKNKLGDLTGKLTSWKGPPKTDATILREAGKLVISGFISGLNDGFADVKATLTKLTDLVRQTHNAGIERIVSDAKPRLLGLAKVYDTITAKIAATTDKLKQLQSDAAALAASVAQSVIATGDVSSVTGVDDVPVTFQAIIDKLTEAQSQAASFASTMAALKSAGLDQTTISQLIAAGPASLAAANAILQSGQTGIAQINALQASIAKSAAGLGKTAADSLYASGIAAAKGLVKGLKSQEAALVAQMEHMGKIMAAALKKALDSHSPSRVMHAIGSDAGAGLTNGVDSTRKDVAAASGRLASSLIAPQKIAFDASKIGTVGAGRLDTSSPDLNGATITIVDGGHMANSFQGVVNDRAARVVPR